MMKNFLRKIVDVLGAFVDANKWLIFNLTTKLRKEKKQVVELQEKLKIQESLLIEDDARISEGHNF
jgi:hypothetical protein